MGGPSFLPSVNGCFCLFFACLCKCESKNLKYFFKTINCKHFYHKKNVEMTKTIFTLTAMTAFIVSRSLRQDHLKVFLRVLLYVCRELVCVIFPFWISNLTSSMNGWIIWSIVIVGLVNWFFIYFDQTSNYLGLNGLLQHKITFICLFFGRSLHASLLWLSYAY